MSRAPARGSGEWHPGDWVYVNGLSGIGRIVSVDGRRGRVRVLIASHEWVVCINRLTGADPPAPVNTRAITVSGAPGAVVHEIDLHGWRVEPALAELERALDRAVVAGLGRFKIIHGHGSGRLRAAVRNALVANPHVEDWRSGGPAEGGLACTIALLRDKGVNG